MPAAKSVWPATVRKRDYPLKRFVLIVSRNGIEVGRKIVEARNEAAASGEIYQFLGRLHIGLFDAGIAHRIEKVK